VYDYQDNYDFNYDGTSSRLDTIYNRMLIKESNLVICSALTMYNIAKRINENSILSYNGNDYNTLTCHSNDISRTELSDLDKPIIGYLGGIRYWFDFELLEYLLENMKNTYIVFIGILYRNAKNNFYKLLKHKNVIWLNYVQHHQLNLYLKKFSIGIIPFKIDGFTAGVFPNKFFEYMAMGIPIVTTALPELKIYSSLIGYSNTKEEFLDYCKEALKGKFDILKDKYRDLAKHNTWEIRAISINKILFSTLMNV
jgi:glycosyltransferase involved in cell wall biosynthesis